MSNTKQKTRWIGRGAWAIADQGLFALANVVLNVLLARWLTPDEYGAFAVAYSCFLFIGAFHTALLTEPLLVFGPAKYCNRPRSYLSLLLRGHWVLTTAGSVLLGIAALVLRFNGVRPLSQALFGLALATPFSLLMWFGRRAAYLRFQPRLATIASAAYLVLLVTGLIGLAGLHLVSIFSAMFILGAAGALTGMWLMTSVRRALPTSEESVKSFPVVVDHWRYGRWAAATSVLMWVPLNLFFVVLSVLVNFEATGAFKALSNLVLPLLQTNAALGSLLLPAMALRVRKQEQFRKLLQTSLLLFAVGACIYSLIIGAFGGELVHLIYGGRYDSQAGLLQLLLFIPLLDGAMVVLSNALRSLERPDRVFWAQLAVVFFLLTAGVEATRLSGLWGAAGGLVVAELLGTIVLGVSVLWQLKTHKEARPSGKVPSVTAPSIRDQESLLTRGLLQVK
jgi:O-antigen/teichoic acid export membrane protein